MTDEHEYLQAFEDRLKRIFTEPIEPVDPVEGLSAIEAGQFTAAKLAGLQLLEESAFDAALNATTAIAGILLEVHKAGTVPSPPLNNAVLQEVAVIVAKAGRRLKNQTGEVRGDH